MRQNKDKLSLDLEAEMALGKPLAIQIALHLQRLEAAGFWERVEVNGEQDAVVAKRL